ncbi:MAG: hypothetical protein F2667_12390 [Actinobacteria bacterium]|uniref:Unannotated protein n=1 Tax=freshwater metagenome TaxID=449393 RepID=A0A6J6RXL6_9ZZZZ|nr:hypothetical protein [Actinomycetota bacterium]
MNLMSAPVVIGAALMSAPALWQGFVTGTMPVDVALTRALIALVGCWVAVSAVAMLVGTPPPRVTIVPVGDDATPAEQPAPPAT